MRIIAGRLGKRQIQSPNGHRTHPMSEKARGGLFGVLGDVSGLTVLDAFAGSGALGLEALSRGARSVIAIDNDRLAQEAIAANIKDLQLKPWVTLVSSGVSTWLTANPAAQFDLILADPPYDKLSQKTLEQLPGHLNRDGTYVLSWPGSLEPPEFSGLRVVVQKCYGDAQLVFYQKTG